jgi:hypothetical protein
MESNQHLLCVSAYTSILKIPIKDIAEFAMYSAFGLNYATPQVISAAASGSKSELVAADV